MRCPCTCGAPQRGARLHAHPEQAQPHTDSSRLHCFGWLAACSLPVTLAFDDSPEGSAAASSITLYTWMQFKLDRVYTDISAVWLWARPDASFAQFSNVTVSVGQFDPGTAVTCTSNLTATAASNTFGPMKTPCTTAIGTSVQYVLLRQWRPVATYLSVAEVLRDGERAQLLPACLAGGLGCVHGVHACMHAQVRACMHAR